VTSSIELFTAPWPGPGNSEGPVDPEGWVQPSGDIASEEPDDHRLLVDVPWPGPGDSEG
jgi:hypothetical protein